MTEKELTSVGKIFLEQIDKKFDEKLQPIKEDISGLKQDVGSLKQDVGSLKSDVVSLKQQMSDLTDRVDANSASLMRIEGSLGAWGEKQKIQDEAIKRIKVKVGIS